MSREPPPTNLRAALYSVIAAIALFGAVSNVLLARGMAQIQAEMALVNTTSRQQMLAEQVARYAGQLVTALTSEERQQARLRLKDSVTQMRAGHQRLSQTPHFNPLTGLKQEMGPLFFRLDTEVQGYLAAANSLLLTPDAQLARRNADIRQLERQATRSLIVVLDEANTRTERQNAERARRINVFAWLRLGSILALLVILALTVFRPLERRIRLIQENLIRERDFAQQIMTTVAQGLTVTDPQGRFEYVNPAYAHMLGVSPESLLGQTPFEMTFSEEHENLSIAKAQRDSGQSGSYETRLRRADGTAIPVLITGSPRVAGGVRSGTIASITDLTQQKENEQTVLTLAALSHTMEQERTPEGVGKRALDLLSQAVELTWLALWELEGERFVPRVFSGAMPPSLQKRMEVGIVRGEGVIWDTLTGQAVYLEESSIPAYVALGVQSVALVPLPASSRVITQVLCAYRGGEVRAWTAREQTLLETAARSIAAALARTALHQQAQEAAEYAQTLVAVSTLVESSFEPAVMAQQVLSLLASTVDLEWGSLLQVRGDHVEVMTAWKRGAVEQDAQEQMERLDGPEFQEQVRQVLKTGQPLYIDDPAQPPLSFSQGAEGVQSLAWIPLTDLNDAGYLFVVTRRHQARAWSRRDRDLIAAAARTVRVAFERQEHLRLLEQASLTDALTGLANRRAFNRAIERMATRSPTVFGLISVDIDGLKQVNDTLGHKWGDLLLQEFGQALQEQFRDQDQVFRLGGDEYVVLLPGCRPEQVQLMLNRVQCAAEEVRRRPELQACGASAGMAFSPEDGHSFASITKTADERMYLNKRRRQQQRGVM